MFAHGVTAGLDVVLGEGVCLGTILDDLGVSDGRQSPPSLIVRIAHSRGCRTVDAPRVEGQQMEALAYDGAQLLPAPVHEIRSRSSRATGVEKEILSGIFPTHAYQGDGEDFVPCVGGVELIHRHGDCRAFDGATLDFATSLPGDMLALVVARSLVMMMQAVGANFEVVPGYLSQSKKAQETNDQHQPASSGSAQFMMSWLRMRRPGSFEWQ